MSIEKYKTFLTEKRYEKKRLSTLRVEKIKECSATSVLLSDYEEAREVMNIVGTVAQQKTKDVIESLVTQALQSVFGLDYSFEVESRINRNKPETFMYVVIGGKRFLLKDELGGGVVDIVSFALRVILWAMSTPQTSNTIILDEPGKFISKDKLDTFGEMLQKLSKMLSIQFIIVTHENDLIAVADKAFEVVQSRGISKVSEV